MTPKEKAESLVESFMNLGLIKMSDYSIIYLPTAKQCALIVVDECLHTCIESMLYYWTEVKRIIEEEI